MVADICRIGGVRPWEDELTYGDLDQIAHFQRLFSPSEPEWRRISIAIAESWLTILFFRPEIAPQMMNLWERLDMSLSTMPIIVSINRGKQHVSRILIAGSVNSFLCNVDLYLAGLDRTLQDQMRRSLQDTLTQNLSIAFGISVGKPVGGLH